MATFLELVQRVASESGTVSGDGQPPTVSAQTGRLGRIVRWTNAAWLSIQNSRSHWLWMRGEFEGTTLAGQARYAGSDFGIARFADWETPADSFSLFRTSEGRDGEGPLAFVEWPVFHATLLRGASAARQEKPARFSVSPQNEIVLWPIPDAVYTIRGLYRKSPQRLVLNTDAPEMPERFHDAIVWRALMLLAEFDEAMNQLPMWQMEFSRLMSDLERDQLPRVEIAGGSFL